MVPACIDKGVDVVFPAKALLAESFISYGGRRNDEGPGVELLVAEPGVQFSVKGEGVQGFFINLQEAVRVGVLPVVAGGSLPSLEIGGRGLGLG